MPCNIDYFNPFSSQFTCSSDFAKLSKPQKLMIITFTALTALASLGILATPVFRLLVDRCRQIKISYSANNGAQPAISHGQEGKPVIELSAVGNKSQPPSVIHFKMESTGIVSKTRDSAPAPVPAAASPSSESDNGLVVQNKEKMEQTIIKTASACPHIAVESDAREQAPLAVTVRVETAHPIHQPAVALHEREESKEEAAGIVTAKPPAVDFTPLTAPKSDRPESKEEASLEISFQNTSLDDFLPPRPPRLEEEESKLAASLPLVFRKPSKEELEVFLKKLSNLNRELFDLEIEEDAEPRKLEIQIQLTKLYKDSQEDGSLAYLVYLDSFRLQYVSLNYHEKMQMCLQLLNHITSFKNSEYIQKEMLKLQDFILQLDLQHHENHHEKVQLCQQLLNFTTSIKDSDARAKSMLGLQNIIRNIFPQTSVFFQINSKGFFVFKLAGVQMLTDYLKNKGSFSEKDRVLICQDLENFEKRLEELNKNPSIQDCSFLIFSSGHFTPVYAQKSGSLWNVLITDSIGKPGAYAIPIINTILKRLNIKKLYSYAGLRQHDEFRCPVFALRDLVTIPKATVFDFAEKAPCEVDTKTRDADRDEFAAQRTASCKWITKLPANMTKITPHMDDPSVQEYIQEAEATLVPTKKRSPSGFETFSAAMDRHKITKVRGYYNDRVSYNNRASKRFEKYKEIVLSQVLKLIAEGRI